jgi:competence protein ComEA
MFKKILVLMTALYAAVCFAAVDVNKAKAADLDGIKGIGPAMSTRILDERKKGKFKDWADFMARVKGVAEKTATSFSAEGLTVNGEPYKATAKAVAAPAAPAAPAAAMPPATPAAPATPAVPAVKK